MRRVPFGNTETIEIEHNSNSSRIIDTTHNLAYRHSHEHSLLEPHTEMLKARAIARAWHEMICAEYGIEMSKAMDLERVHHIGDHTPVPAAAAKYEPGCVDGLSMLVVLLIS